MSHREPETSTQRRCVVCHAPIGAAGAPGPEPTMACSTCRFRPDHQRIRREAAVNAMYDATAWLVAGLEGMCSVDQAITTARFALLDAAHDSLTAPIDNAA